MKKKKPTKNSQLEKSDIVKCPFCEKVCEEKNIIRECNIFGHIICIYCFEEKSILLVVNGKINIKCFGNNKDVNNNCSFNYEEEFIRKHISKEKLLLLKEEKEYITNQTPPPLPPLLNEFDNNNNNSTFISTIDEKIMKETGWEVFFIKLLKLLFLFRIRDFLITEVLGGFYFSY
jgi:hypothetical protein